MSPGFEYTIGNTLLDVKDLTITYQDDDGKPIPVLKKVNFEIKDIIRPGLTQGQVVALLAPSGMGKCLAKGTQVMMFDGTIKPVENVVVGDLLMGPNSTPRTVLGLGQGIGKMYDIIPSKGESYRVNGPHILALELTRDKSGNSPKVEITVEDYLNESPTFKARAKTYRVGVDFEQKQVPLDPYMLGLWLSDGDSDIFSITNEDPEIVDHIFEYATANGLKITPQAPNRYNLSANYNRSIAPISSLRKLGVWSNKHIPHLYKANDRNTRLSLLAGIIDGDGHLSSNCYDIVLKIKTLADDVAYVARSLGFAAYVKPCMKTCTNNGKVGNYYRICISGNTDQIPVKIPAKKASKRTQIKNVLRSGFRVVPVGVEDYYGFELDGDKLFLLGDFTVTHNTQTFRAIAGLNKPTSGSVFVNPNGADTMQPVTVGSVGVVAQDYPLFNHRTVMQNLMLSAMLDCKDRTAAEKNVTAYLERFKLDDKKHHFPHQLSGGQRQRVAIIQQMVCNKHLLLMDEPFSGLDIIMKEEVQTLISDVAASNELNSVIVTTHDIQSAIAVADTILLLGRERDPSAKPIPGAFIKHSYNLIEMGLTWHPDISNIPAFVELEREIKARFKEL